MHLTKHLKKPQIWYLPLLAVVDTVFFGSTDPNTVSSMMLIIGYLLIVITIFGVFRVLGRGLSLYGVPRTLANRVMGMLSGIAGLCLALSSVGELSLRDIVVIVPLAGLLYVYLFYAKPKHA